MTSRFRSVGEEPSPVLPLPPVVRRGPRRTGPALWLHAADRFLRRLSGGDRIVHNSLRAAAVPLVLGLLFVLWTVIF